MKLVDAVKNDCVQYIQDGVDLALFLSNSGSSTGRNPSQSQRAEECRADQLKRAEIYAKLLEDDDAIQQEAEELRNPHIFIPGGKAKHRPPMKQKKDNPQGKVIQGKGKKIRKKKVSL